MVVENHKQQSKNKKKEIVVFIDEFKEVFGELVGLPLKRAFDHQIPLKEGTGPISVRPYKYPHYQKTKIKNIMKDLL